MSDKRYLGNIITPTPTAPAGTARPSTIGSAKGVWSLSEAFAYQKAGQWPSVVSLPGAPTIGSATAGSSSATVSFTAPAEDGGLDITQFTATSTPESVTGTGSSSPVTVTGLTNGTSYTFRVSATTAAGTGALSASSNSVVPTFPDRALFAGGSISFSETYNTISFVTITTTGNSTDFGDLTVARRRPGGCSSSTRGVFGGGSTPTDVNIIDFVSINSTGNAADFGDLVNSEGQNLYALSSSTRGIFAGGNQNILQFITIASTGNASDFGDATQNNVVSPTACASTTRGIIAGGGNFAQSRRIDFVTIATTGNAAIFGDLLFRAGEYSGLGGCSNSTRGVFAGAPGANNIIDFITIASTGNATDFGDLTYGAFGIAGAASSTRGVFAGGNSNNTRVNNIAFVTISTTGNAFDFGDLSQATNAPAGCSNAHGGLS